MAYSLRSNLKTVYFNNTIREIGFSSFASSSNLKNIYLNDGLKTIGSQAFSNCNYLEYVVIPDTVKYIGSHAFTNVNIFSNNTYRPDTWAEDFAIGNNVAIYFKHTWYYDENGIPTPKDNI